MATVNAQMQCLVLVWPRRLLLPAFLRFLSLTLFFPISHLQPDGLPTEMEFQAQLSWQYPPCQSVAPRHQDYSLEPW